MGYDSDFKWAAKGNSGDIDALVVYMRQEASAPDFLNHPSSFVLIGSAYWFLEFLQNSKMISGMETPMTAPYKVFTFDLTGCKCSGAFDSTVNLLNGKARDLGLDVTWARVGEDTTDIEGEHGTEIFIEVTRTIEEPRW